MVMSEISGNIKEKTELLKDKVEEELRCREYLYQVKNEL